MNKKKSRIEIIQKNRRVKWAKTQTFDILNYIQQ